jgi:hypothetical protein
VQGKLKREHVKVARERISFFFSIKFGSKEKENGMVALRVSKEE